MESVLSNQNFNEKLVATTGPSPQEAARIQVSIVFDIQDSLRQQCL